MTIFPEIGNRCSIRFKIMYILIKEYEYFRYIVMNKKNLYVYQLKIRRGRMKSLQPTLSKMTACQG